MRAFQLARVGLDGLEMVELPAPRPGAGQVRVRVRAASLNYRDLAIATGAYARSPIKLPLIPLSDGAGEVVEVGKGVTGLKPGDRVMANFFPNWRDGAPDSAKQSAALGGSVDGVLAEEVVWEADAVLVVPPHLSWEEAATLPCAGLTAWVALRELGGMERGQTLLALGTGGVSVFALQIAKASGCRAIVTSSSDEKLERARGLGADGLVNYRKEPNWDSRARELSGGDGVDQILEVAGGKTLPKSLAALKQGGHLTLVGFLSGERASVDPAEARERGIRVDGIYVGSVSHFRAFRDFVQATGLKPVVDRVFELTEARRAYDCLQEAGHFGKLVIRL